MTDMENRTERRCPVCVSRVLGKECSECGALVVSRPAIGILAGVNNNFGVVNNVYNMGPAQAPETEIVDLRDIQDGLNDRFPERVLAPPNVPIFSRNSRALGGGSMVKKVNIISRFVWAFFLLFVAIVIAIFLWA